TDREPDSLRERDDLRHVAPVCAPKQQYVPPVGHPRPPAATPCHLPPHATCHPTPPATPRRLPPHAACHPTPPPPGLLLLSVAAGCVRAQRRGDEVARGTQVAGRVEGGLDLSLADADLGEPVLEFGGREQDVAQRQPGGGRPGGGGRHEVMCLRAAKRVA